MQSVAGYQRGPGAQALAPGPPSATQLAARRAARPGVSNNANRPGSDNIRFAKIMITKMHVSDNSFSNNHNLSVVSQILVCV